MCTCDGLSFTEVLVSLLLVTSASLVLLKQQWHINQFMHQLCQRNLILNQRDNTLETLMARGDRVIVKHTS